MKYLKSFLENNQEIDYINKYGLYPEDIKDMFYDLQELGYSINVNFSERLIPQPQGEKNFKFNLNPFISVVVRKQSNQNMNQRMVEFDLEQLVDSDEFNAIINTTDLRLKDYGWKINHIGKELDHINISICKINI
jgi:hypothetical protein